MPGGTTGPSPPGLEESQEGPQQSRNTGFRTRVSPSHRAGWERLLCSLCNCVAERLPRSRLYCVTGATAWGRGWGHEGAPHFIPKVLHLCDGVGWGGNHWCYRSRDAPPPGQQMFLFVQSLFLFFVFFFFLWMGTHVNFLKVLFNVGERVPAPDSATHFPLSPPPRRLSPLRPLSLHLSLL